jgi:hypothetical protein
MISVCGTVWGRRHGSFVYAIFADEYVYFGETGDTPPGRWGQHLGTTESSLFGKLLAENEELEFNDRDLFFVGLYCGVVDEIEQSRRKIARRAIEEALHRQYLLNKNLLPAPLVLLSTPPPPAVRHRFPFKVEEIAEEAFGLILNQYTSWSNKK